MTCNRQKTKGSAKDILWCRSALKLLNYKNSTVKDQLEMCVYGYKDTVPVAMDQCTMPSVAVHPTPFKPMGRYSKQNPCIPRWNQFGK